MTSGQVIALAWICAGVSCAACGVAVCYALQAVRTARRMRSRGRL